MCAGDCLVQGIMIPTSRRLELYKIRCGKIQRDKSKRLLWEKPSKYRTKEKNPTNTTSEPYWKTWPLGLMAGDSERGLSDVSLSLSVLWPAVLTVMLFSLPSLPRSPPTCTRTTTTCGLSRNITQTQVMWCGLVLPVLLPTP